MTATTLIEKLGHFAAGVSIDSMPEEVLSQTKRILLDSIGCALASAETDPGRVGIAYGTILGAGSTQCTVIGSNRRSSLHGAAFANTELIAALDMAPISPPAHVAPYVIPVALGFGESNGVSGERVLSAIAAGLEVTCRFALAMDTNRAVRDGRAELSRVMGFATSIFGTAIAGALTTGMSVDVLNHALGIAAGTTPVNALRAWQMHVPNTSVKYSLGGGLTLAALNALFMAQLGHRGDPQILDDTAYGYRRFIATERWEPDVLVGRLGVEWLFPAATHFKPYPHCRVTHALFDALIDVVQTNSIRPAEIETITAYGEEWATGLPTYMNREIERPYDSQFSFAHGLSLAAHLVPPGRAWQNPAEVYRPSVLDLMSRVVWKPHAGWAAAYAQNPNARPSRIEVAARGTIFSAERSFPRGSTSPDPTTTMTTVELTTKFAANAAAVLDGQRIREVVDHVLDLENVDSVAPLIAALGADQPSPNRV